MLIVWQTIQRPTKPDSMHSSIASIRGGSSAVVSRIIMQPSILADTHLMNVHLLMELGTFIPSRFRCAYKAKPKCKWLYVESSNHVTYTLTSPPFTTTWDIRTAWQLRKLYCTSLPSPIQFMVTDLGYKTTSEFRTVFHRPLGCPYFPGSTLL